MPPPAPQSTVNYQATSAVYTNRVDNVHEADNDGDIGGVIPAGSRNAEGIEREYVDGEGIGNFKLRVTERHSLCVSGGANVAEPNGRRPELTNHPPRRKEIVGPRVHSTVASKIPNVYLDVHGLSPRRRRKNRNKGSTGNLHIQREEKVGEASTESPTKADTARDPPTTQRAHSKRAAVSRPSSVTKSLQRRVEDRLHELGDELQRRRNCSPKHPAIAQQQRREEKELLECTFVPTSFTGTYVRATARATPKVLR